MYPASLSQNVQIGSRPLGWLIGGQLIGIGTNIVYTRFP
jgi:hypothetical protein